MSAGHVQAAAQLPTATHSQASWMTTAARGDVGLQGQMVRGKE